MGAHFREEIMRPLARAVLLVASLCAASVWVLPASAGATLPGLNGAIAFGTADVTYLGSDEEAYAIDTLDTGVVDANGRHRRIVAGGGDPAFSPRGRLLAIGDTNHGIDIRRRDGTRVARLTRGNVRFPTWSPSGRRLAFARQLPTREGYCEWTDSQEVRYDSSEPCPASLYTIRRDGRDLRLLVERGWNPSWSSRGEIAYEGVDGAVWGTDGRGTEVRRIVAAGADPDWSPEGGRIAFVRQRGGNSAVFVVNRNGTGLRRLYVSGTSLHSPAWSPDGRRIAFVKDGIGLYTLSLVNGSRPSKLMGVWCPNCAEIETLYGLAWQPLPRSRGG